VYTHVRDITQVLEYEDLNEEILVGHIYGGLVIGGVAEAIPERIKHLV
jgi:pimeloyl-ACP methyl ester carboxylesterase